MSFSDTLAERLDFMQLDQDARQHIRNAKSLIMKDLPSALDKFYGRVKSFPETRKFFSSQSQIDGAKSRQLSHWETISSGQFDQNYVRAVTSVGEVHARIGLEPRWYIGGYAVLLDSLIGAVVEARWPKGGFGAKKGADASQVACELGALAKATLLDMDYAISVYLEAAEAARRRAEAEVLAKERASVVSSIGESMAALARGDLTYRMAEALTGEYG